MGGVAGVQATRRGLGVGTTGSGWSGCRAVLGAALGPGCSFWACLRCTDTPELHDHEGGVSEFP